MRVCLLAWVLAGGLAACGSSTPPPRQPVDPAKLLGCEDAASAFALGFGAATTHAKEKGVRDKAYKALILEIEAAVAATCAADRWSEEEIKCLARSTTDETLAACRDLMGDRWIQVEAAADAALATYGQSYEK